ncbi:DNA replication and repair protein RecN [Rhizobiales bacterium GAS191]|nr:DNA replication and repair protein RecN [Rhizobiales bacterium GAS191]
MLVRLSVRDIVLIDRLDIDFSVGLSALTGETGAGKSILLDAFALALGARGDGSLVRHGAEQGQVTAVFELERGHPALRLAQEADIATDDGLILRRVQYADGRTRALINDQPVGVQTLRALGNAIVEIHGQHDERALLDSATHRSLLDAFGDLGPRVEATAKAHAALSAAAAAAQSERELVAAAKRDADYLGHAHQELSELAPEIGEEEALSERRTGMQQAEKIAGDLAEVHEAVAGHSSPSPALAALLRRLERRADQSKELIEPILRALGQALDQLEEARQALERALAAAAFDQGELDRIEERLFALRAASRKYGVPADKLQGLAAEFAEKLAAIDAGEERLALLDREVKAAMAAYEAAATELSEARAATAQRLDLAVTAELAPLKLEQARFMTRIESDRASRAATGFDRVEFHVQTNPGTRPGPLMKVASGGELSRFLLALKVVVADRGSAPTLVFDEIDSGVGGAVADAIGQRLARLAERVQVIGVTHAPQVAARAQRHYLISKAPADGGARVITRLDMLDAADRREEIARMLAGATITQEARAAAERLLAIPATPRRRGAKAASAAAN